MWLMEDDLTLNHFSKPALDFMLRAFNAKTRLGG